MSFASQSSPTAIPTSSSWLRYYEISVFIIYKEATRSCTQEPITAKPALRRRPKVGDEELASGRPQQHPPPNRSGLFDPPPPAGMSSNAATWSNIGELGPHFQSLGVQGNVPAWGASECPEPLLSRPNAARFSKELVHSAADVSLSCPQIFKGGALQAGELLHGGYVMGRSWKVQIFQASTVMSLPMKPIPWSCPGPFKTSEADGKVAFKKHIPPLAVAPHTSISVSMT